MFAIFKEFSLAQQIILKRYNVIFYAESAYYFQYFRHLFENLIADKNIKICYLTADVTDPVLQFEYENLETFHLKATLGFVFSRLQADIMILTMPDLNNFHLKRSAGVREYIYVFHAMVSVHQQYRAHAFNHYDTFFCVGLHHVKELAAHESRYKLPKKNLIKYGYPLLHQIFSSSPAEDAARSKILIAPSWYKEGILSTCILAILDNLNGLPYEIWVRPHPEFVKRYSKEFKKLQKLINATRNFHLDNSPDVFTHLLDANYLITDRSGIAFEYYFIKEIPVLFIETPPKIQNPDYIDYAIDPVENKFRDDLGIRISIKEIPNIPSYLKKLDIKKMKATEKYIADEVLYSKSHWVNGINYIKEKISL